MIAGEKVVEVSTAESVRWRFHRTLGVHVKSMHTVVHITIDENEALSTIYIQMTSYFPRAAQC